MRYEQQGHTDRYHFDSWMDFAESVTGMQPKRQHPSTMENGDASFYGTRTFDAATQLARLGWPEGSERVDTTKRLIVDRIAGKMRVQEPVYDVTGLAFDMGRVMSGEPECWLRWEDSEREIASYRPNICRIVYNQTVSAGVATETIEKRGAAVMALVELLELAGIRAEVTIDLVISVDYRGDGSAQRPSIYASAIVKRADEYPNRDSLAYALVHVSTFRRFGFRIVEHSPQHHYVSAYGFPCETPDGERGDIYIGEAYYGAGIDWNDSEAVDAWLIDQLRKQGVEFTE